MGLAAVRTGLKNVLGTVSGLRTYDFEADDPTPPCAVVLLPERIDVQAVLGPGWTYTIPVRLFISRGDDRKSDDQLEAFLDEEGDGSIVAAIDADPTLGGACSSAVVLEVTNIDYPVVAGVQMLACDLMVEVLT
jgi:hypothetical protein